MARKPFFRQSIALTQRQSKQALLALAGTEEQRARIERDFPEADMRALPKSRAPAAKPSGPVEADVLRAVSELLSRHPKVSYALRVNSGMASYEAKSGRYAPVHFHVWLRSPVRCRMPDIFGALVDGRTLALEVKRAGWKEPRDKREFEQAAFLMLIRNLGGIGEFITSADQVAALLA